MRVPEHIRPPDTRILFLVPEHILTHMPGLEHTQTAMFSITAVLLAVAFLVREHTPLTILVPELILAHMQTHLLVQELTQETIPVLEHILVLILVHIQVIQFKQLKIQYQQYLSGFAPLKLYYILYIISFYGELNDCG